MKKVNGKFQKWKKTFFGGWEFQAGSDHKDKNIVINSCRVCAARDGTHLQARDCNGDVLAEFKGRKKIL